MKNLLKSVMIVCTMAVVSSATAASFTVKETSKNNVFQVQYASEQKGKVEVSIKDNKNEVVYKEEIFSNGSFIRPYNFSNLPYGDYTIVIKDENGERSEKVSYNENKIVSYTYMAAVPNQESKYWLNVRNNGFESINVKIIAQDGAILFEQTVAVEGAYNTVFNLAKVKANQAVTFEITNGSGKIHTSTFN